MLVERERERDLSTPSNVVETLPCKTLWKMRVFAKITSSACQKNLAN